MTTTDIYEIILRKDSYMLNKVKESILEALMKNQYVQNKCLKIDFCDRSRMVPQLFANVITCVCCGVSTISFLNVSTCSYF